MMPQGCFCRQQMETWFPGFDRTNLTRWTDKGLLLKLRQGWYAFAESKGTGDFSWLVANQIYQPSYISLHYALAFYGMIPETVVQYTSVTTLKTAAFQNALGYFVYQKVVPSMFFGYEPRMTADKRAILFATPEKALMDLLYLNPFYDNEEEFLQLRLDEYYMAEELNVERLLSYLREAGNKALEKRTRRLLRTYGL